MHPDGLRVCPVIVSSQMPHAFVFNVIGLEKRPSHQSYAVIVDNWHGKLDPLSGDQVLDVPLQMYRGIVDALKTREVGFRLENIMLWL
jgi:hypothetical protein